MLFSGVEVEKLYAKDSSLKRTDVKILQEWLKKQPHLPQLEDVQLAVFLHSCYYRIEKAKITIDNYFTVRTHCPEIFKTLTPEELKYTSSVGFITILPKKTPQGNAILMFRLNDFNSDNFNCLHLVNFTMMVTTLYLHQDGFDNGATVVVDMKGFSLGHLIKLNITTIKHAMYYIQEAAPVRIKEIHIINTVPFTDKFVALVKPFLKNELYNMLQFHPPSSKAIYNAIPKECLPEEYNGELPSCQILQEKNLENLVNNYDFFEQHHCLKVDEEKRTGISKNSGFTFGVEGTFKKLEID